MRRAAAKTPGRNSASCRRKGVQKCRRRRAVRHPDWVRPFRRAQRALDSSASLILAAMAAVLAFADGVERRPVRTCRGLTRGIRELRRAVLCLLRAKRELAEAREALSRMPVHARGDAPEILELASERWRAACHWLQYVLREVALRQVEVLAGLACGELVPEHPSDSRPRIAVTPRPLQVRAFLASRQHRAADRITSILRRRRRTPRPAALSVPPRTSQGRAPPFSSTCAL